MKNSIHCQVCGDVDSSPHFGAISCRPCKMFFKRNAEIKQVGNASYLLLFSIDENKSKIFHFFSFSLSP